MGRANNISRSLGIISRGQGWDPSKIDGQDYPNGSYPEDRVTKGDTGYLSGPPPKDPQEPCPDPSAPGPDTRSPGPGGKSHGTGNPYGDGGRSQAGA